jgi:putative colanic acid biosynthesis acetyltransferase WcaF
VIRKRLGLIAGSLEVVSIHLASFVPSNSFRIFVLRLCGAHIGRNCAVHHGLQVRAPRKLHLGDDCFIAENVVLDARGGLTIGAHVSVNSGAQIWTAQHDWRSPSFAYTSSPVTIGDRAWISARATVLPGLKIGDGSVVAAGAVVSRDVDEWTLVGGVPAKKLAARPIVDNYSLLARQNKIWWW